MTGADRPHAFEAFEAVASVKVIKDKFSGQEPENFGEGQTIIVEHRWPEGSEVRLRDLAAELVQLRWMKESIMPFTLYKDYEIQSVTIPLASGQWQVEVRVFSSDGCQVGVQFLPPPDDFATAAAALQAGMVYGRQQIDALGTARPLGLAEP